MILVDFGGPESRFWKLFDALSLERALSLEEATTYEKPVKSYGFTGFSHVPCGAHALKIRQKSIRRRFANASRDRSLAKGASFDVGGRKMAPKSPPGRLGRLPGADFGALGGLLGRCGGLLGRSGALSDRSWCGLGALMGRSWALLSALGRFWTLPGRFWLDFSPPEIDFGTRF